MGFPRIRLFLLSALLLGPAAFAKDQLTFEQFRDAALTQNLGVKIEAAKSEAAQSSAGGIDIPPPMVGFMRMRDQSGSSANGFEISQTIPFPTKISNGRSARKFERDAQAEAQMAMEADVRAKAKVVYYNLWASQQRLGALKEKKGVIESHIRLARARVRSDSFLRIYILKAESDFDLLENEILAASQDVKEKETEAATFLNVNAGQFHPSLKEPPLGQIPNGSELSSPHQLEFAKLRLQSSKARETESKSTWFPDLYLRYKEVGQTQMMPQASEIMVGISLPFLFPWDATASSGKASSERLQSELELQQLNRKIDNDKAVLFSRAESLKKQLDNIEKKLLPRAEKRMKLVHNLAPRDMETLRDHRETMEAFPDLKLRALNLRGQYEEVVAELTRYERGAK